MLRVHVPRGSDQASTGGIQKENREDERKALAESDVGCWSKHF